MISNLSKDAGAASISAEEAIRLQKNADVSKAASVRGKGSVVGSKAAAGPDAARKRSLKDGLSMFFK